MDEQTAERIHARIDQINATINEVKLSYTQQHEMMKNLDDDVNGFIRKVDDSLFHIENGFISKTKNKLSSLCVQVKNQWYLITVIFLGILGIAWRVLGKQ